ncbi:MAG: Arc family DNA-binding protein [Candidatus Marinimicrobia bacterium]|nr:Arc family DNA-binding protein [Candidatus Neomarinimicrobiota bacterium]MCH8010881.1 Arc family DNA-binding protein [Candidatus Neomarinimicrobiota bacterium]MCH8069392.1 Arc family DNA-binding protein [Candidatus Neomarinimicrobiota bacterium]
MSTLTIKNIPNELYERVKESAKQHRRSINSEVIVCLEHTFFSRRIDPDTFLARIHSLRQQVSLPPLTDEFLKKAKNEGRP